MAFINSKEGIQRAISMAAKNVHMKSMDDATQKVLMPSPSESAIRLHGIDIFDKYQGVYTPQDSPPKPVDFVICKFSEGYYSYKEYLDKVWLGAKEAKSHEGYHYWRTAASLTQQYDSFMASADGREVDAAWLDWETTNNVLNKLQYERMLQWCEMMQQHFPKVGFYTNKGLYHEMNVYGKGHQDLPFWYAHYWNPVADPYEDNPVLPDECPSVDTWQYGITQKYGNKELGTEYGVQSKTLDVNIRFAMSDSEDEVEDPGSVSSEVVGKLLTRISALELSVSRLQSRVDNASITLKL